MKTMQINWKKVNQKVKNSINYLFGKVKNTPVTTKESTLPEIEEKEKGRGRAFQNRKTTNGRRSQYIPIGKDSMGNTHYKLICHSY
jgi:hypothetical protein